MTTYQMIQNITGAPKPLVIEAKRAIIGKAHKATTQQIHEIIAYIRRAQVTQHE